MFDECVAKPAMLQLRRMVCTEAVFDHVCDRFLEGADDLDWIPPLGEQGGWIVITSDAGKQSKRGHKLPEICRENCVTHVVMSSTLHHKTTRLKAAALATVWDEIERLHNSPPGARFNLRYRTLKKHIGLSLYLEPVAPPTAAVLSKKPGSKTR